ncbi:MAG: DNA-3-methyladenine glycosylase family protein [Gaiellaceae bacterium]
MIEVTLRPRGPYSLRLSTRLGSDATRIVRRGVLRAAYEIDGGLEIAEARQLPDGAVVVRAQGEAAVERVRFTLGLDDDHSEFVARFSRDPFLGATIRRLRGLRPLRSSTVTQAVLRALCGQLITARRAREIERRIVREGTPSLDGLHAAPTPSTFARFAPAELRRLGLGMPRASALVRLCRSVDLERLREVPTDAAATRLLRESRIGPWSVGVICLEGLGRYERGLIGDLGLIKLLATLRGRWVEGWETAELLEPYGEWAGLASVYMLAGFKDGTLPISQRLAA